MKIALADYSPPCLFWWFCEPWCIRYCRLFTVGILASIIWRADMMVLYPMEGALPLPKEQCKRIAAYIKHPIGLVKAGCPALVVA